MKTVLSFLLFACAFLPLHADWTLGWNGLRFTENDGEATVTNWSWGTIPLWDRSEVCIPDIIGASTGGGWVAVTRIGDRAFQNSSTLTSITIPASVTSIGAEAFKNCSSLTRIRFEGAAPTVGADAFSNVGDGAYAIVNTANAGSFGEKFVGDFESWEGFTVISSVLDNLRWTMTGGKVEITDCNEAASGVLIIPATIKGNPVTSIGNRAFKNCLNLRSVTIPNTVTNIEVAAFCNCGLESITIPENVTSIGSGAFQNCSSLESITFLPLTAPSLGTNVFLSIGSNATYISPRSVNGYTNPFGSLSRLGGERNDLIYTIHQTMAGREVTITDCKETARGHRNSGHLIIPDTIEGSPVTSIGSRVFENCYFLTNITIPDSVTSIGDRAFLNCDNLKSIIIPDGVTSIEEYTFNYCENLESVTIGSGVTCIKKGAFALLRNFTSITIPDGVTSIGVWAFEGCISLKSISIPEGVTSIESGTFRGCRSLQSVTIPDSVTEIGSAAFNGCSSLTSITIPNSVTKIESYTFRDCNRLTSIAIPDGVTSIGAEAFYFCLSVPSFTIPEGVTKIESDTFGRCYGLTRITIPDSVSSIGERAFERCRSLTSIIFQGVAPTVSTDAFSGLAGGARAFVSSLTSGSFGGIGASWEGLNVIDNSLSDLVWTTTEGKVTITNCNQAAIGELDIPSTLEGNPVTSIGQGAFSSCASLASITIPDGVISIGDDAFRDCTSLASITIPNSVTSIGEYTFYRCSSLTGITIPDSVTSIRFQAFYDCTSLTSITIPDSVTSIETRAFNGCSSLASIIFEGAAPTMPFSAFKDVYPEAVAYVRPEFRSSFSGIITHYGLKLGSMQDWLAMRSLTWTTTNRKITITDCDDAAIGGLDIPSAINGNPVVSIGTSAFRDCSSLTSITIPGSVTTIGPSAFNGCSSLTSITIPNSVTKIESNTFQDCSSLTSIMIPYKISSIGTSAFENCSSLTEIAFEGAAPTVNSNAFLNVADDAIAYVKSEVRSSFSTIAGDPNGLTLDSFQEWLVMRSLTWTTTDGKVTITDCDEAALGELVIPDTIEGNPVTRIGNRAFAFCIRLTSVTIPASVSIIENRAFSSCISLKSIVFRGEAPYVVSNAFFNVADGAVAYVTSEALSSFEGIRDNLNDLLIRPEIWTAVKFSFNSNEIKFSFDAIDGASYRIEVSEDLVNWAEIESSIIGEGQIIQRSYTVIGSKGFLRAVEE